MFMKSLEAVKESDKAKELIDFGDSGDATSVTTQTYNHNNGDARNFTSISLEFVELYILAFKSMPAIETHDLPRFDLFNRSCIDSRYCTARTPTLIPSLDSVGHRFDADAIIISCINHRYFMARTTLPWRPWW